MRPCSVLVLHATKGPIADVILLARSTTRETTPLEGLMRFVEQGGILEGHRYMPEEIRQQLYAEEQHSLDAKGQKASTSVPNLSPSTLPIRFPHGLVRTVNKHQHLFRHFFSKFSF
jgi:hypothetical protein